LDASNLSPDKEMDPVDKWLIITRAAVFSVTTTSGSIGGLFVLGLILNLLIPVSINLF
jgi:hypothetical protein